MDKHHFGNSRVHEVLAGYLTELADETLCRRSTAMLQQYNLDMREVSNSNLSYRMKTVVLRALKELYELSSVNETIMGEDEFLRTILINVLTVRYRKEIARLRSQYEKETDNSTPAAASENGA